MGVSWVLLIPGSGKPRSRAGEQRAEVCGVLLPRLVAEGERFVSWERRESPVPAARRVCVASWYLRENRKRTVPSPESSAALFDLNMCWSGGVFNLVF